MISVYILRHPGINDFVDIREQIANVVDLKFACSAVTE